MPDITFTIPSPILNTAAGDYFKARYQTYPGGAWSSYSNYSTQTITITGLALGSYRLEVIYVRNGTIECDPAYVLFDVVDPVTCVGFSAQITKADCASLAYLEITYTLPSPYTDPPCGHDITYITNGVTNTVNYSALPISGLIKIQVPNASTSLTIKANLCNGEQIVCFEDTIAPAEVPCQPHTNLSGYLEPHQTKPGQYYIRVSYTMSCPRTIGQESNWIQTSNMWPLGTPPDSGVGNTTFDSGIAALSNTTFSVVVKPNSYEGELSYKFRIKDVCGVWHELTLTVQ